MLSFLAELHNTVQNSMSPKSEDIFVGDRHSLDTSVIMLTFLECYLKQPVPTNFHVDFSLSHVSEIINDS